MKGSGTGSSAPLRVGDDLRPEKVVGEWTAKAANPRDPKKFRRVMECETPMRDYRGVGGSYVAQVALAQGWELRPTDMRKEVRLWWSAAS